ncbi:MAG: prepilin-type N-terminal cleavage/methylation domain-containing protein [Lachnospiraceae bacterium]|nr:prepilin-type N-terminal cleavage/methylation domain-containing protein [Lachnospiraceae bacterium]
MKTNKGFSLVEILISVAILAIVMLEVFAMMSNSSTLYRNGTYEVELQTEAQRVITQLEDLMIDCDGAISANYIAMVSSDEIVISDNEAEYIISLSKVAGAEYGDLVMTRTDRATGATASAIPMAEYVRSISLNMANYTTASVVTLTVEMQNDMYTYSAMKDVYLRNQIGLSGNRIPPATSGTFDFELDVLRYKEYSLSDLYNTDEHTYVFEFEGGSGPNADDDLLNADYRINKSGTRFTLQCQNTLNHSDTAAGPYIIIGTDTTDGSTIRISIATEDIHIGAEGYAVAYLNTYTSDMLSAYIDIAGISVTDAERVTYEVIIQDASGTSRVLTDGSSEAASTFPVNLGQVECRERNADGNELYFRMDRVECYCDGATNCVVIQSARMMDYTNYYELIEDGCVIVILATIEYDSRTPVLVRTYGYPLTDASATPMTEAQNEAFWDMVE